MLKSLKAKKRRTKKQKNKGGEVRVKRSQMRETKACKELPEVASFQLPKVARIVRLTSDDSGNSYTVPLFRVEDDELIKVSLKLPSIVNNV